MKSMNLFYQGEGVTDLDVIELQPDATVAVLKAVLVEKHGIALEGLLVFLEDEEEPIEEVVLIGERIPTEDCKVHVHHCRHVHVTVSYNGEPAEHRFSPSATVARIKHWAAVKKFGMSEEEAGEHVLQLAGTHDRRAPGTHIGSLTHGKVCSVAFDLVPDERIHGAP